VPLRPSTTCSTCSICSSNPSPSTCSGLGLPTRRSPDLRVQIFLSCAMFPSPSTRSGDLAMPIQGSPDLWGPTSLLRVLVLIS
jgi:hypothetical protein